MAASGGCARAAGRPLHGSRCRFLALGALLLGGCGFLESNDPNSITYDDLDNPAAAAGLVAGLEHLVAEVHGRVASVGGVMSDEMTWIGSLQDWGELDRGRFDNPANQFSERLYIQLSEARWLADEALRRLADFTRDAPHNETLARLRIRARLMEGLVTVVMVDYFEDFVISDRTEAEPPLGREGMIQRTQASIQGLDQAAAEARQMADEELELRALSLEARARAALALFQALDPAGLPPTPVLISNPAASALAQEVVGRGGIEWSWSFVYNANSGPPHVTRAQDGQLRLGDRYVTTDPSDGTVVTGPALVDPNTGALDARAAAEVARLGQPESFPDLGVTSGRGMALLLAEGSLANGDAGGFRSWIDRVRDLDGRGPSDPALPDLLVLEHERQVQHFLQGRRLLDLYRFAGTSDNWDETSAAITRPGARLPIARRERETNPHIAGSSGGGS